MGRGLKSEPLGIIRAGLQADAISVAQLTVLSNCKENTTVHCVHCVLCNIISCLLQSRANVAEDAVLVNSVISDNIHVNSAAAVVHCNLTSPIHINSGCTVIGLCDSDISVSKPENLSGVFLWSLRMFILLFHDEFFSFHFVL